MLWYLPWSESIKKRACRYLLQRYLGNFLEEKLTLDQLSVDLYNGTGTVCDVSLDCDALNELGDSQNWPLEIVDGQMKEITVTIPWSTILKDDSLVVVNGLSITVQPKVRAEPGSSMLESMWSSMSSSMQLAKECLQKEDGPQEVNPVEGIEMFAHAIDSILSRVKVKFTNSKIRIEHVPKNSDKGIALEIHIDNINYFDEAGSEPSPEATDPGKPKTYIVATYTSKKIKFSGVTFYTDEFPSKLRTMARSLIMEKSASTQKSENSQLETSDINYQSTMSEEFYETRSVISTIDPDPIKEVIEESIGRQEYREISPEERASQPDPILFAKLNGNHELALKIKHSPEVEGPKIEISAVFGSFLAYITPRQLHSLIDLVNALNEPHLEDTSNIPLRPNGGNIQCKPMRQADFQVIEAQLLNNLEHEQLRPSATMYGWSGPGNDDSDAESDKFLPMSSQGVTMSDSFSSSVSSMSASVTSSVNIPTMQPRIKRNKKVPHIDGDPTAEVSHISLRINSLTCILLHKDILVPPPIGPNSIIQSAANKLQQLSTDFFNRLGLLTVNDYTKAEFYKVNDSINTATEKNHLRVITSEIAMDGSEKKTAHGSQVLCEATVKHALLRECLYYKKAETNSVTPECFDIVQFDWKDDNDDLSKRCSSSRPNIRINFKQTSKYMRVSGEKKLVYPTTDVNVKCTPFAVDVDLTLIDRMSATFFGASTPNYATSSTGAAQDQFNLTVQSPNVDILLRFPIADLRPGVSHDVRRIRPDYLMFKLDTVKISSQQAANPRPLPVTITMSTTNLDLFYYESDELPPVHVGRGSMDENNERNLLKDHNTSTLPTISLTYQPPQNNLNPFDNMSETCFEPAHANPMTTSIYIMNNIRSTQPSPFSAKKMAHQSFTKHEGSPHEQEDDIIVPGSEEEMSEFTTEAVDHSSIHLDFNIPLLSLQLESKQLYEILYNRLNSDLLLWEPRVSEQFDISPHIGDNIYPAFGLCKGGGYDSDSGSSSSEEENLYYSTYDNKPRKSMSANKPVAPIENKDIHNFCLTFKVGKGLLTVFAPVRDSNKRVVPGQMGELVLEAQNLSMCSVTGINGIPKTAQLCLRAAKTTLFHEATLTIPSEKPSLRTQGTLLPSHLKTTIYPSGKGVMIKDSTRIRDMFTLALKVEPDKDTPNLKTSCIAIGIEHATLRHRGLPGVAWLFQLMDVLDVADYPVLGYVPNTTLSQLHVIINNTAVHYRPLYLPISTVATIGTLSISSNLIAATNTSCLRFLAQECTLFLSHIQGVKPNKPVPPSEEMPDLGKDYVCVVDVGLFELSLRIEEKSGSSEQPQVDLSASNNMVTLYTCWDTAAALCRLITYIAAAGDSQPPRDDKSNSTSICSDHTGQTLVGLEERREEIRELSPSEIQHVNDLMEEALKESPNTTLDEDELNSSTEKEGVEVFFFPDESEIKQRQNSLDDNTENSDSKHNDSDEISLCLQEAFSDDSKPTSVQVASELGDPSTNLKSTPKKGKRKKVQSTGEGSNTDDEYCIIENQVQSEDLDIEEPVVTWLGQRPTYMCENHFHAPTERSDVLKPPKSFPQPILRYTLCEMSVTWNLYGGNDFGMAQDATAPPIKKTVTIETDPLSPMSPTSKNKYDTKYETGKNVTQAYRTSGVSWSSGSEQVRAHNRQTRNHLKELKSRGGPLRDHNTCVKLFLSKVKFQHETYPQSGVHASRQTLAISKIEILDRLQCSDINKLLGQYKIKDEPDRKNAHMLIIKAVHLRGERGVCGQECCLKISVMPLRVHLDQDTLAFLARFGSKLQPNNLDDDDCTSLSGLSTDSSGSKQSTPTHRPPVMSVGKDLRDPQPSVSNKDNIVDGDNISLPENVHHTEPLMETYEAERLVSENLIQLEEDFQRLGMNQDKPATMPVDNEPMDDSPIYFRRVVFSPEVPIRLDYVGKRVDLAAGPVAGLLMGLAHLNCSELTLKRLDYRLGLLGVEKLLQWALHEWLTDMKRHQLPGLLGGIGPMHSLLQLMSGIRDLVWLPVEQWRRDGRVVHGLRRGAASFTARTAVAALDVTARLLLLIQATAETAFDMLSPTPTVPLQESLQRRRRRRRRDAGRHPSDIREGVATAYLAVKEGWAETTAALALGGEGARGAGVLRRLPGAAVAPLALAAAGAAELLGGVRASIAPHRAHDHRDKWRLHTDMAD